MVVKCVILTVVIYFELHLGFLLLGVFVEGVTGGYAGLMIASFSYTSDQHTIDTANKNDTVDVTGEPKLAQELSVMSDAHPAVNGTDNHAFENTETEGETGSGTEQKTSSKEHEKDEGNSNQPAYDGNRAVRLLAIECFNLSSMGVVQLVLGYFIKLAGFFYVSLTASLILIVDLVYTWFVIKNVKTQVSKV